MAGRKPQPITRASLIARLFDADDDLWAPVTTPQQINLCLWSSPDPITTQSIAEALSQRLQRSEQTTLLLRPPHPEFFSHGFRYFEPVVDVLSGTPGAFDTLMSELPPLPRELLQQSNLTQLNPETMARRCIEVVTKLSKHLIELIHSNNRINFILMEPPLDDPHVFNILVNILQNIPGKTTLAQPILWIISEANSATARYTEVLMSFARLRGITTYRSQPRNPSPETLRRFLSPFLTLAEHNRIDAIVLEIIREATHCDSSSNEETFNATRWANTLKHALNGRIHIESTKPKEYPGALVQLGESKKDDAIWNALCDCNFRKIQSLVADKSNWKDFSQTAATALALSLWFDPDPQFSSLWMATFKHRDCDIHQEAIALFLYFGLTTAHWQETGDAATILLQTLDEKSPARIPVAITLNYLAIALNDISFSITAKTILEPLITTKGKTTEPWLNAIHHATNFTNQALAPGQIPFAACDAETKLKQIIPLQTSTPFTFSLALNSLSKLMTRINETKQFPQFIALLEADLVNQSCLLPPTEQLALYGRLSHALADAGHFSEAHLRAKQALAISIISSHSLDDAHAQRDIIAIKLRGGITPPELILDRLRNQPEITDDVAELAARRLTEVFFFRLFVGWKRADERRSLSKSHLAQIVFQSQPKASAEFANRLLEIGVSGLANLNTPRDLANSLVPLLGSVFAANHISIWGNPAETVFTSPTNCWEISGNRMEQGLWKIKTFPSGHFPTTFEAPTTIATLGVNNELTITHNNEGQILCRHLGANLTVLFTPTPPSYCEELTYLKDLHLLPIFLSAMKETLHRLQESQSLRKLQREANNITRTRTTTARALSTVLEKEYEQAQTRLYSTHEALERATRRVELALQMTRDLIISRDRYQACLRTAARIALLFQVQEPVVVEVWLRTNSSVANRPFSFCRVEGNATLTFLAELKRDLDGSLKVFLADTPPPAFPGNGARETLLADIHFNNGTMHIPIVHEGEGIGLLSLGKLAQTSIDESDRVTLETLTHSLATTVRNMELLEEQRIRWTRTRHMLSETLTQLNLLVEGMTSGKTGSHTTETLTQIIKIIDEIRNVEDLNSLQDETKTIKTRASA